MTIEVKAGDSGASIYLLVNSLVAVAFNYGFRIFSLILSTSDVQLNLPLVTKEIFTITLLIFENYPYIRLIVDLLPINRPLI